jgi:hypothetical protein
MSNRRRGKHMFANTHIPPSRRLGGVAGIAATLAVGLVAAGCGSSSSHTASTTAKPALTKAQFLAQGNAICAQGNQKSAAAAKALEKVVGNHAPTQAQITAYVNGVFVPLIQSQIDQIKALGAPSGEQAALTRMLDIAQTDLNAVKSNPAALVSNNSHPFANFAQVAHRYGLTACASKA